MPEEIRESLLIELLNCAFRNQYHVLDGKHNETVVAIERRALQLMAADYSVQVLDNSDGELGVNYPSQMALLGEYGACQLNVAQLRKLALVARMGRCRGRFPVGVILYNNRQICRSATLSVGAEMYPRHYYFSMFGTANSPSQQQRTAQSAAVTDSAGSGGSPPSCCKNSGSHHATPSSSPTSTHITNNSVRPHHKSACSSDATNDDVTEQPPSDMTSSDPADRAESCDQQLFDKIRNQDVRLLQLFGVGTIADLMVETKKVKFGIYVASSEKVDKFDRYANFHLLNIPYPGCEFFRRYQMCGYQTGTLVFDWSQKYINSELSLPTFLTQQLPSVDFSQYRSWHTAQLTANYLKLLLLHLHTKPQPQHSASESGCGLLIHCISGWDRTPLFISLLRLTLWADGLIHQSLDASQILYLTLAYDWFLFGHDLPDRISRDQEVMHFAFNFLKVIESDEFSALNYRTDDNKTLAAADNQLNSHTATAPPCTAQRVYDDGLKTVTVVNGTVTIDQRNGALPLSPDLHDSQTLSENGHAPRCCVTERDWREVDSISIDSSVSALSVPSSGSVPDVSAGEDCYGDVRHDNDANLDVTCWPFVASSECVSDTKRSCLHRDFVDDGDDDEDDDDEGSIRVLSEDEERIHSPVARYSLFTEECSATSRHPPLCPLSSSSYSGDQGVDVRSSVDSSQCNPAVPPALLADSFCRLDLAEDRSLAFSSSDRSSSSCAGRSLPSVSSSPSPNIRQSCVVAAQSGQHEDVAVGEMDATSRRPSSSPSSDHVCSSAVCHQTGSSPLNVPVRNRHESCGSVGSWQIISECSSARSSVSNGSSDVHLASSRHDSSFVAPEFLESTATLIGESSDDVIEHSTADTSDRAQRLRCVRRLFLKAYSASVGLKIGANGQRVVSTPAGGDYSTDGGNSGASGGRATLMTNGASESSVGRRIRLLPTVMSTLAGRVGLM